MSLLGAGTGAHTPPACTVKGIPPEMVIVTFVVAITARYRRVKSSDMSANVVDTTSSGVKLEPLL